MVPLVIENFISSLQLRPLGDRGQVPGAPGAETVEVLAKSCMALGVTRDLREESGSK
jgi:hypothetical protein